MTTKFVEPTNEHVGQIVEVEQGNHWEKRKLLAILPVSQTKRFICQHKLFERDYTAWNKARIPRPITYTELQEESGLKVGDMVKVLRRGSKDELGWENVWIEEMDKAIGQVCTIREITKNGIRLDQCNSYDFPCFVLEKYEETKEEKIENLVNEFVEKLKKLLTKANEEV